MATEEQLKVTITTVADTRGAQQVSQALTQVQRQSAEASGLQEQIRRAGGFDAYMRGVGTSQTQAAQQVQQHAQATRTVTAAVREQAVAQQEVHTRTRLTGDEFVRFATAALGVGSGLSIAATAGHLLESAFTNILQTAITVDQSMRDLTATFGAAAAQYQQFAAAASRGGAFSETDIRASVEAIRPLAEQFQLTTNQVEGLSRAAQTLSTIWGLPLAETTDALTAAMHGNAAAADKVGLSLTDQQVAARALGGTYRQVWDSIPEGEKVTLRYGEALKQVDAQQRNVAESGKSITTSWKELQTAGGKLAETLGQPLLQGLASIANALHLSNDNTRKAITDGKQQIQDWTTYVNSLPTLAPGTAAVGMPGLAPPQTQGPRPQTLGDITNLPQTLTQAQQALQQIKQAVGDVATATDAQLSVLAQRTASAMVLQAAAAQKAIQGQDMIVNALNVALQRSTDPAERQKIQALLDQINAVAQASQAVLAAQREQNNLRYQSVQLSAQEAQIRLGMLPAQERMAALQRDMAEQQIRARQAALPATEVAEDLRYMQQRDQLIARNRFATPAERSAARAELRGMARAEPGIDLAALDAQRGVVLAGRAATRVDMQAQLQSIAEQRALASITNAQQQTQLLSTIAQAAVATAERTLQQQINLQINVIIDGQVAKTIDELIQANGQAKTPPTIQFSPMRRV